VLLRFSAAHEARPRRTARTFAGTVVVFVSESSVFVSNADLARAAVGGGPQCGPSAAPGAYAVGWPGPTGCVRAGNRRDFGGAEQRSLGVGARSAHRTSDSRRLFERSSRSERSEFRRARPRGEPRREVG